MKVEIETEDETQQHEQFPLLPVKDTKISLDEGSPSKKISQDKRKSLNVFEWLSSTMTTNLTSDGDQLLNVHNLIH